MTTRVALPRTGEQWARASLWISAVVAGIIAFWGGWTRRWMSDDGLIVLRTVRNILAGNGPVFNAGERVEANTSTLWQYLIAAFGWIPGTRLEIIALWLSLILTVVGAVTAVIGSGKLWQGAWSGAVVPFGVLIYFALPPARDFATSGLEWGLCLAWFGVWWLALVAWSRKDERKSLYWLAFWSGLSWLVRPELALYGGLTGLVLLLLSWGDWRRIGGIALAALPVPAAYQIFRMGYYGVITPHTAVAKSASDSQWGVGGAYLWDTVGTYALWLPVLVGMALLIWFFTKAWTYERVAVVLAVACGTLHLLYVVRVGGDFMHGRMVLLPLFALLLPIAAVPLRLASGISLAGVAIWASVVVHRGHPLGFDPFHAEPSDLNIVDEREFWTATLLRESGDAPLTAEDFLTNPLLHDWPRVMQHADEHNDAYIAVRITDPGPPRSFVWDPYPRLSEQTDLQNLPPTVYFTNLGMTSMNADLDVRIADPIGLATPLAARSPRLEDWRIGHDKDLAPHWRWADSAVDPDSVPDWMDKEKLLQARAALRTPDLQELLATSREPMSTKRFFANLKYSVTTGRSLEIHPDPAVYLDEETLKRISAGEDVGRQGAQVAWPVK